MELLVLILIVLTGLAFLKGLAAIIKGGVWLVAVPFKLVGSVLGLLIGIVAFAIFIPALLVLVIPVLLVALLFAAGALILK